MLQHWSSSFSFSSWTEHVFTSFSENIFKFWTFTLLLASDCLFVIDWITTDVTSDVTVDLINVIWKEIPKGNLEKNKLVFESRWIKKETFSWKYAARICFKIYVWWNGLLHSDKLQAQFK